MPTSMSCGVTCVALRSPPGNLRVTACPEVRTAPAAPNFSMLRRYASSFAIRDSNRTRPPRFLRKTSREFALASDVHWCRFHAMSRATKVLAGTTILGFLASVWLYLDNRSLREEVQEKTDVIAKAEVKPAMTEAEAAEYEAKKARDGKFTAPTPQPVLEVKKEHRLDRRKRRQEEFAAMFGRNPDETEEQWRERVAPLIAAGLMKTRLRTQDTRRIAEEKAKVTPEQSAKIDQAMEKVYADV